MNIHWWGLVFIAIGIALWMSGLPTLLCSIVFVIGLIGLVLAWITRFESLSEKMKSDNGKALAELIRNRLGDRVTCAVYENQLSIIWPRVYEHDSRIKEIEAFAKANDWSVSISDPGIRLTFKKLKV